MSDKHVENMTEAELADYYYEHRDDPDLAGEQVEYRAPRGARLAVRLSFDEEREVREAAERAGMSVSAFLRQAALNAASEGGAVDVERVSRDLNAAAAALAHAQTVIASTAGSGESTHLLQLYRGLWSGSAPRRIRELWASQSSSSEPSESR